VDECELTLPADQWLPVDDRGIPSGKPRDVAGTDFDFRAARKLAGTKLDHAFTGLRRDADGLAWVRLTSSGPDGGTRSGLWADAGYRWLQVFTGDPLEPEMRRTALAVEPMTCPPNAFASGEDLVVLAPGESATSRWGIKIF
jgi:aldose 1-epimerase